MLEIMRDAEHPGATRVAAGRLAVELDTEREGRAAGADQASLPELDAEIARLSRGVGKT